MQNILDKLKTGDGAISAALWIGLGVVILIVVVFLATWLVRALRPTLNMSGGSGRGGRPQRLAVTDAFNLDREGRKLVIIRRDNTEHLLLIGGPTDIVVESNILRGERSSRDRSGRDAGETVFPGDVPLPPEPVRAAPATPVPTMPQPVPAAPALPASPPPMMASASATIPPMRPVAPPPPLRPAPSPLPPPPLPSAPPGKPGEAAQGAGAKLDEEFERALAAMQSVQRQQTTAPPPPRPPAPPIAARPAPAPPIMPQLSAEASPAPARPSMPAPAATPAPEVQLVTPRPLRTDASSEMARRLSEVMQKPLNAAPRPVASDTQPPSAMRPAAPATPPPPATVAAGSEMDLLEEEMARLLGRPSPQRKPDAP